MFRLPVGVEVDEHVHAAVEAEALVQVEVGVWPEVTAGSAQVESPAFEVGVGEQLWNAGDRLEETQEACRRELFDQRAPRLWDDVQLRTRCLAGLVAVGEGNPVAPACVGEVSRGIRWDGEQFAENEVGKRLRSREARGERCGVCC